MPPRGSTMIVKMIINVAGVIILLKTAKKQKSNSLTVGITITIRNVPKHLTNSSNKMIGKRFLIDISNVLRVALVI